MTQISLAQSRTAYHRMQHLHSISMTCYYGNISGALQCFAINYKPTVWQSRGQAQKITGSDGQTGRLTPRGTITVPIRRPLSWLRRVPQIAVGDGRMKGWSADELAELRAAFASLGVSPETIDEQIRVLDNIAKSWVDQIRGFSSIKLTLSQRANYSFEGVEACDKFKKSKTIQRQERSRERQPGISDSKGPIEP